jgi:hypothetical protein
MTSPSPQKPALGSDPNKSKSTFVMTERAAHEAWSKLCIRAPRSAALLHILCAKMGTQNALVASHAVLAELCECSVSTLKRSISDLKKHNWIDVKHIGPTGTVCAYIVNDEVVWGQARDQRHLSTFRAQILISTKEQTPETLEPVKLRRIPTLYPGESQLPHGPGDEPPSQPSMPGLEPDLPSLQGDAKDRHELEVKYGQGRLA